MNTKFVDKHPSPPKKNVERMVRQSFSDPLRQGNLNTTLFWGKGVKTEL